MLPPDEVQRTCRGTYSCAVELGQEYSGFATSMRSRIIGYEKRFPLAPVSEGKELARIPYPPKELAAVYGVRTAKTRRTIQMAEMPIDIAYPPAAEALSLRVAVGACRFAARPGDGDTWIAGTYHDPTDKRTPRVLDEGSSVTITEAEPSFERIPSVFGGVPRYELQFGKQRPFALTIETGASEFDLDLGGVPLRRLAVRQGAGKFELSFSAPNPEPMEALEVSSGAAGIELGELANANFSEMRISGGAAGYGLDFGGVLSRDARVSIETGLSGVEISVPASTAARIFTETTLGRVDVGDGFTKREGAFLTEGVVSGGTPVLEIRAGVRLGALQLRVT